MKKIFLLLSMLIMTSASAFAVDVNSGDEVNLVEDINEDAYIFSSQAVVDANVRGDLYLAGSNVEINGDVEEDLLVVADRVILNGNVGEDARIIAKYVEINGQIGDDLAISGHTFKISNDTIIGGNIIAAAIHVEFYGELMDEIVGLYRELHIGGIIHGGGDISIDNKLILEPGNQLIKPIYYTSIGTYEIQIGDSDKVIKKEEIATLGLIDYYQFWIAVLMYVTSLLTASIAVYFVPVPFHKIGLKMKDNVIKSFTHGLATIVIAGFSIAIFTISGIGIPFALILISSLILVFLLSSLFAGSFIAGFVYKKDKKIRRRELYRSIALGLAVYYAVGLIPVIGNFIQIILALLGIGAFVRVQKEYVRVLLSKEMI